MRILPSGEPFMFKGSAMGCLLVHGFPGSPLEMTWLGQSLYQRGFSVLGVRLFGHATEPADLLRVHAGDWLADLEDGYHWLRGMCTQVVIIGLSLGAVLSAALAPALDLAGLTLLAMPMDLPPLAHRLRPVLPLLKHLWRYRRIPEQSDWHDSEAERLNLHYPVQPLHAIGHIFDLLQQLPEALSRIHQPTLLIYSRDDHAVPIEDGIRAHDIIPVQDKELLLIEGSGHNLLRDARRELIFEKVGNFVQQVCEHTS